MHWVIQENMFNEEGFARLLAALDRLGVPHSLHKVVPFVGTITPEPTPAPGPVIVMGTISMAREAARRGWWPGSFLDDETFTFDAQVLKWGAENMLNGDSDVCRFGSVRKHWPSGGLPIFLRPVDDSKAFVGQVIDGPRYTEWLEAIEKMRPEDGATLTTDTFVQVAPVKRINAEYRTWCVRPTNRTGARANWVVTASQYKFGTIKRYNEHVDQRVLDFAEQICDIWTPADAFCLDVADTDEGLKIVEVNNINSAGFYAADMQRLVMELEDYVAARIADPFLRKLTPLPDIDIDIDN